MSSILEQFLLLPVTPPGNLAYHAVLAFTIFGALQGALNTRRTAEGSIGRRATTGLLALLLLQILQFTITGLIWQGLLHAENLVPVLDRTAGLLALLIIIWLWTYPKTNRLADAAFTLVGLGIVALAAYALIWWQAQRPVETSLYFNATAADVLGGGVVLVMLLIGIFVVVIRRPGGWGFGLGMFLGLAAGYLAHWFAPLEGSDFAGGVRLAEMAVYPLLLALPQRYPAASAALPSAVPGEVAQRPTFSNDLKAQQELLKLALSDSPRLFYQELARVISQLMVADFCLLALPQIDTDYLILPVGYNLVSDSRVEGFSLEQRKIPALINALRSNTLLHLPADSTSRDLPSLAACLKVERGDDPPALRLGDRPQPAGRVAAEHHPAFPRRPVVA